MRLEIVQVSGPVPTKRSGTIDLAALADQERRALELALRPVLASRARGDSSPRARLPDVGSAEIAVFADDGTETRLRFSEAEATAEQAALLKAVRPFLKIAPWRA